MCCNFAAKRPRRPLHSGASAGVFQAFLWMKARRRAVRFRKGQLFWGSAICVQILGALHALGMRADVRVCLIQFANILEFTHE